MRKQVPLERTNSVLEFSTKHPLDRLAIICNGLSVRPRCLHLVTLLTIYPKVLNYGESEYVRQFGLTVADEPLRIQARVINGPTLKYHQSSQQSSIVRILFPGEKMILKVVTLETNGWGMESVCYLFAICSGSLDLTSSS